MMLTNAQLLQLGLKCFGENVKISDKVSIYNPSKISIGDNVRIDDFCILSAGDGGIEIGSNIHIACHTSLIGKGKIMLRDYSNISSYVAIYSSNDDYSGMWMTSPVIPEEFTNVTHGDVTISDHVLIGSHSVILPNATLKTGCVLGAMSLLKEGEYSPFSILVGIPAVSKGIRSSRLLLLQHELENLK